jgi:hypothetical protein
LHRDISVNNLLINRSDSKDKAIGLLIDFDFALQFLHHASDNAPGETSGASDNIAIGAETHLHSFVSARDETFTIGTSDNVAIGAETQDGEARSSASDFDSVGGTNEDAEEDVRGTDEDVAGSKEYVRNVRTVSSIISQSMSATVDHR